MVSKQDRFFRGKCLVVGAVASVLAGGVSSAYAGPIQSASLVHDKLTEMARESFKNPLKFGNDLASDSFQKALDIGKLGITNPLKLIEFSYRPDKLISFLFGSDSDPHKELRQKAEGAFEDCVRAEASLASYSAERQSRNAAISVLDKAGQLVPVSHLVKEQSNLNDIIGNKDSIDTKIQNGRAGHQMMSDSDKAALQKQSDALQAQADALYVSMLPAMVRAKRQDAALTCYAAQLSGQQIILDSARTSSFPRTAASGSDVPKLQKKLLAGLDDLVKLGNKQIIGGRILKMQDKVSSTSDLDEAEFTKGVLDSWNEVIFMIYKVAQNYSDMAGVQKLSVSTDTAKGLKNIRTFVKGMTLSSTNSLGLSGQYLAVGAPGRGTIPEPRYPRFK